MTLKIYPKTQLLSAALGLSCLMVENSRVMADNISELYPLNFYDYRQPDSVFTGNSVPTLYDFVGARSIPARFRRRNFRTYRLPGAGFWIGDDRISLVSGRLSHCSL